MFSDERYRLKITVHQRGCEPRLVNHYYVIGRRPKGGVTVRVLIPEHFELNERDTLMFDFTTERIDKP